MATHSSPRTRLHVTQPLAQGAQVPLEGAQAHYLLQVLRGKTGDPIALFNGSDGEWQATLEATGKKTGALHVESLLRPQVPEADIWLLYAPLKNSRSEWVAEKATELGISRLCPVQTQFTIVDRVNEVKFAAICTEAAQQCERISIPEVEPLLPLERVLRSWPADRQLIYGDESGAGKNARDLLPALKSAKYAVLIGPEGGFSESELVMLRDLPYVSGMCLGPRILRADTAAVAALALVQAFCGDWEGKPAFRN